MAKDERKPWMKALKNFRFNREGTMLQSSYRAWRAADVRGVDGYLRRAQFVIYQEHGDCPHSSTMEMRSDWIAPSGEVVRLGRYRSDARHAH